MPVSQLTLSIDDLKAEIGAYLGYGRGTVYSETAWTTLQSNNITAILKSGLSQVYTPPPLAPGEPSHNWSFLRPMASITIADGSSTAELPSDFGGFESSIYITSPSVVRRRYPIRISNVGHVEQMHAAEPDTVGFPRIAAEKVLPGTSRTGSTRSVLYVWPTADSDYTLSVEYKHLPEMLTGGYPYPPGGSEHSELFKASCLAAAELQLDDAPGPRQRFFMERLAASVYADRKRKGQFLGYNGDRSDWRGVILPHSGRMYDNNPVTYNGDEIV